MSQIAVFRDLDPFLVYAKGRAQALSMDAHRVPLSDCEPQWMTDRDQVARPDGRFYQVGGVRVTKVKNREVSGWSQPMIVGETDGRAALVTDGTYTLVRFKADSGNCGIEVDGANTRVLVAPALQFSQSNLDHNIRALRGELDEKAQPVKPVPLAGILTDGRFEVRWFKVPQDGARFFEKVDALACVKVNSQADLEGDFAVLSEEEQQDFAWVCDEILEAILKQGMASAYLWMSASFVL